MKKAKLITLLLGTIIMVGCTDRKFHITGTLTNAKDSTLYFEHNTLDGITIIDSLKLDQTGQFEFTADTASNPEFYRLRIADQIINLAIDSTETLQIKASYPGMATNYEVANSPENQKIKELALKQIALQNECQNIMANRPYGADSIINQLIENYKQHITRNYIYREPMKAYSYFALFQYIIIGNQARLIFDPSNEPKDNKVFGAVATSWDTYFPGAERTQNLHNIALQSIANARKTKQKVVEMNAEEAGVIDIPLRDNLGHPRHLTELKGKVVLLNFHVFAAEGSTAYIMHLRDIYNKFHNRGFEIYMVSLDDNAHFWKEQVSSLPWINVYDNTGVSQAYTAPATVSPIIYLINRNNEVVRNPSQITNLEAEIARLL